MTIDVIIKEGQAHEIFSLFPGLVFFNRGFIARLLIPTQISFSEMEVLRGIFMCSAIEAVMRIDLRPRKIADEFSNN